MDLTLALVALLIAAVAGLAAWRSAAAARRLALEMIQLRDRLARAERRNQELGGDERRDRRDEVPAHDVALQVRVADLEERLRDALIEPAQAGTGSLDLPDADAGRERVRRHLRGAGYEHVAILGEAGAGAWLIEAERDGLVAKGLAEVDEEGTVRLRAESSARAFP